MKSQKFLLSHDEKCGKASPHKISAAKVQKSMRQSYKSIKISTFAPENSNTNQTFARKREIANLELQKVVMEILRNLFYGFPDLWGGGVAHSVMILALVITLGLCLGKIRVKGVSLGLASDSFHRSCLRSFLAQPR